MGINADFRDVAVETLDSTDIVNSIEITKDPSFDLSDAGVPPADQAGVVAVGVQNPAVNFSTAVFTAKNAGGDAIRTFTADQAILAAPTAALGKQTGTVQYAGKTASFQYSVKQDSVSAVTVGLYPTMVGY